MKKQLLFLFLALFAIGIASVNAQTNCPVPRAITCLTSDALHPIAGTPYTYEVTVPSPAGAKMYQWWVTQDQNFVNAGVLNSTTATGNPGPFIASASAWYNISTLNANTISITWQSFTYDPLNPVFVVINVVNQASCNTQNLKVYKIEPQNAFTLDIANVTQTGVTNPYDSTNSFCIHDIVTATYSSAAPEGVLYDFGVDYMYFAVTAANWNTSWLPSIQLTGIDPLETVAVEWAYSTSTPASYTAAGTFTLLAGTWTTATPVLAQAASGSVGSAGECILIRVTLDHSLNAATPSFQGLTNEVVTCAVDGVTNILVVPPTPDVHYTGPVGVCGQPDSFTNDIAMQTLFARPTINTGATMPLPGLLPVKP